MIYGGIPCYLLMNDIAGYSLAPIRLSVLLMCHHTEEGYIQIKRNYSLFL